MAQRRVKSRRMRRSSREGEFSSTNRSTLTAPRRRRRKDGAAEAAGGDTGQDLPTLRAGGDTERRRRGLEGLTRTRRQEEERSRRAAAPPAESRRSCHRGSEGVRHPRGRKRLLCPSPFRANQTSPAAKRARRMGAGEEPSSSPCPSPTRTN